MLKEMKKSLEEREKDFIEIMEMYRAKRRRTGTKLEAEVKQEEEEINEDRENVREAEASLLA